MNTRVCIDCLYQLNADAEPLCPECGRIWAAHELLEYWSGQSRLRRRTERNCAFAAVLNALVSVGCGAWLARTSFGSGEAWIALVMAAHSMLGFGIGAMLIRRHTANWEAEPRPVPSWQEAAGSAALCLGGFPGAALLLATLMAWTGGA